MAKKRHAGHIARKHIDALKQLKPGWDSHDGVTISPKAIEVAERLRVVPLSDGGIQVQITGNDCDIEIEFSILGYLVAFDMAHFDKASIRPRSGHES